MPDTPNSLFISHDTVGSDEVRRHVRSRAAQHSHRNGGRKPKTSKRDPTKKKKSVRGTSTIPDDASATAAEPPASRIDRVSSFDGGIEETNDGDEDSSERTLSTAPTSRRQSLGLHSQHTQLAYSKSGFVESATSVPTTPSIVLSPSPARTLFAYYPVPALPWYPRLLEYSESIAPLIV